MNEEIVAPTCVHGPVAEGPTLTVKVGVPGAVPLLLHQNETVLGFAINGETIASLSALNMAFLAPFLGLLVECVTPVYVQPAGGGVKLSNVSAKHGPVCVAQLVCGSPVIL